LLEAGETDRRLIISMPAVVPFTYQDKRLNWGEEAGPEPHLDGRMIDEKRGPRSGRIDLNQRHDF
jgi:choline dehydrogenase